MRNTLDIYTSKIIIYLFLTFVIKVSELVNSTFSLCNLKIRKTSGNNLKFFKEEVGLEPTQSFNDCHNNNITPHPSRVVLHVVYKVIIAHDDSVTK